MLRSPLSIPSVKFLSTAAMLFGITVTLAACGGSDNGGTAERIEVNSAPVADAGPGQDVETGTMATLDASGSSDADGDPLTCQWQLVSQPAGSDALLSDPSSPHPTFFADEDGHYVVSLVVNDGTLDSAESTVTVTASTTNPVPEGPVQLDAHDNKRLARFQYKEGPLSIISIGEPDVLYFELTKDYTVDIGSFFTDIAELPSTNIYFRKRPDELEVIQTYIRDHYAGLRKWDFIELYNGFLTIKKGYRWDGASTPWSRNNIYKNPDYYIRASCVHDAMYDLMRMGYLENDLGALGTGSLFGFGDARYMNRLIADIMLFILMVDDGRRTDRAVGSAYSDYDIVRSFGAPKTWYKNLLDEWKYHVSELAGWVSETSIDLHWRPADVSGKDPKGYVEGDHNYFVWRFIEGKGYRVVAQVPYSKADAQNYQDSSVMYTDKDRTPGKTYYYWIGSDADESGTWWTNRRYDESDYMRATPLSGSGNALNLQGNYRLFAADTLTGDTLGLYSIFFAPLTLEAWVLPEYQRRRSAILAFNAEDGTSIHVLAYDGEKQSFCYYNDKVEYCSASSFSHGEWYHVALTVGTFGAVKLYVNGVEEVDFQIDFNRFLLLRTSLFSVGHERSSTQTSERFKGQIDEVRVWNRWRGSEDEIVASMCVPLRGSEEGLIGLWNFDEVPEKDPWYNNPNTVVFRDATIHGHSGLYRFDRNATPNPYVTSGAMPNDTGDVCDPDRAD